MFARVAFDLPVPTEFTYAVPERLRASVQLGQRVRVPFRTTTRIGYLVAFEDTSELPRIKDIASILDPDPLLPAELMQLARWISGYYCCSLGEVIQAMLPGGVRKSRPKVRCAVIVEGATIESLSKRAKRAAELWEELQGYRKPPVVARLLAETGISRAALQTLVKAGMVRIEEHDADEQFATATAATGETPPELEPQQSAVLDAIYPDIEAKIFRTHLLLGVTGSGKTEVYLRAIDKTVRDGRQAIVLVPEIALTPQTVRRFRARFDRVAVLHSAQSESERRRAWTRIRRGEADVVIGPRSAIFAPVPHLGLVVVDEEHENSFKQETTPRYHARDVALVRAKAVHCPVLLGSATPSLESYSNALRGRYVLHRLPHRVGKLPMPPVELVDMSGEPGRLFSPRLRVAVQHAIDAGGQVILFLNRRGFATLVLCGRCKHMLSCPHCSSTLVFHKGRRRAACHLCGHETPLPDRCPECHQAALKQVGSGTEKVLEEAERAWPRVTYVRVDSDTARGDQIEEALDQFRNGAARILVGTQMVAKGHHFPNVTLVGIVNADTALHLPDFRANERTFSLIAQVAGRAGRSERGGRVIVQTYNPGHYAVALAAQHDFEKFARAELEERELLGLPPLRRCALLVVSGEDQALAKTQMQRVADSVRRHSNTTLVEVRGPAKAPLERLRGRWRFMVLMLSTSASALAEACAIARGTKVTRKIDLVVDMDPAAAL